jgi:hypothetical protein
MAIGPRTPFAFAAFTLAVTFVLGVSLASQTAITFDVLGRRTAATLSALLIGMSNLPLAVVGVIIGRVETASGASAMLLTETWIGLVAVAAYALVASLWRFAPAVAVPAREDVGHVLTPSRRPTPRP